MSRLDRMRFYSPHAVEEEAQRIWSRLEVYEKLRKREGRKFYFLDGPPYPSSGSPHPGTAWNKVLKDSIIRYMRARGYLVRDQPGWDCHGLPIEVAVEKKLGFKTKKDIRDFGIDRFIDECWKMVSENVKSMTAQFKMLGVSMNWEKPYMTLNDSFIESEWYAVKRAAEQGLLEEGMKVVHWCPRCETALAEHEVSEYRYKRDYSIYVKFPVVGREREYIVIWTTTPWTLPANVAVMVHPDEVYVRTRYMNSTLILAKKRLDAIEQELGATLEVIEELPGRSLEGLEYRPPLLDEVDAQKEITGAYKVVLSREYVTMEEGSGCVHSAPGHGEEDFEVAHLKYGMPVLMLVDDRGFFTEKAGKYAGKSIWDASHEIVKDLEERGLLLASGSIVHRYPICWRCKSDLILRATKQWYIKMTKIAERLKKAGEVVKWVPRWGWDKSMLSMLEDIRDWVISRQRFWGTPLPIWRCSSCRYWEVVGSKRELEKKVGGKLKLPSLHRPWVDTVVYRCPKCGGEMKRVPDVLDVWFDSGAASFASLGYPEEKSEFEKWWPVDLVIEGHDQFRGWFYSLLRVSVIMFGQPPYRAVLAHGFMLDEKGREMHKSLGNFVEVSEIVRRSGRDPFRLFVLQNTTWSNLKFIWKELEEAKRNLNVIWNIYTFLLTAIEALKDRISVEKLAEEAKPIKSEDRWLLSRLNSVISSATESMDEYQVHNALRQLINFAVEDVSHFYIRVIRRRIWGEEDDMVTALKLLYRVLKDLAVMLAPFVPHFAEISYQRIVRKVEGDGMRSVCLEAWPTPGDYRDPELERQVEVCREVIAAAAAARMEAKLKLRQPVGEVIVVSESKEVRDALEKLRSIVEREVNCFTMRILEEPPIIVGTDYAVAEFSQGKVYVKTRLERREIEEGLFRETVRRLQSMRKSMGLRRGIESIKVAVWSDDEDYLKVVEARSEELMKLVNAVSVSIKEPEKGFKRASFEYLGRKIVIGVQEV